MRCLLLSLSLTLLSCSTLSHSRSDKFLSQFTVKEIAPQTYVVTDLSYHNSNVMVAVMPDQTVLIASSPFETQGADALLQWIRAELKPRKVIAINTHFHADGTGGNEAYKAHGVEIWASDLTRKLQQERGESQKIKEAAGFESQPELKKRLERRQIVIADHEFRIQDGKTFEFGGEKVEVIYPGPAHSSDNVAVHLPQRKVLFGGCMIRPVNTLGYVGDADVKSWADSVSRLKALAPRVVIAGHETVGGQELIDNTVETARQAVSR
ncbi:metallo-beta-lactamase [Oligoflexus tunisiensis]|uniref:metallo-beta-lactamase n=1 Tax=Oligoflexus tunisiensis TaxID=708132 RepID=UPI00159F2D12|nr:metallo-beta-lactamase [Oligoflexus tunisiensis]